MKSLSFRTAFLDDFNSAIFNAECILDLDPGYTRNRSIYSQSGIVRRSSNHVSKVFHPQRAGVYKSQWGLPEYSGSASNSAFVRRIDSRFNTHAGQGRNTAKGRQEIKMLLLTAARFISVPLKVAQNLSRNLVANTCINAVFLQNRFSTIHEHFDNMFSKRVFERSARLPNQKLRRRLPGFVAVLH